MIDVRNAKQQSYSGALMNNIAESVTSVCSFLCAIYRPQNFFKKKQPDIVIRQLYSPLFFVPNESLNVITY